jgi:hypothetical protein
MKHEMKKRLLWSLLLMLLFAAPIKAELVRCLVVQLSSNAKLYYPAALNPVATFEGTVMHLNTDVMELSTVAKLTMEMVELVGVQQEKNMERAPVNMGQTLFLNTSELDVQLFNLSGKRMNTAITRHGETYSIDLNGLPSGAYIVRAGSQSWKFIKH